MWTVYKHTSPSGKVYIGITSQKPEARWKRGKGYSCNEYFSRAINKYGWENIEHEILYTKLTKEEAEQKEIELIKFYDSTNKDKGYNISTGGHCFISSEESKKKISNAHRARAKKINQYDLDGNLIKTWDCAAEAAETLNINRSKIIDCCRGGQKSASGYQWRYFGDNNIGAYNGDPSGRRKVNQYDLDGNLIKTWDCICDAAEKLNIDHRSIIKCCTYKTLSASGYQWRYFGDDNIGVYQSNKNTPVNQYDLDGNLIKTWDYIKDVEETLNIFHSGIVKCCSNKQKTAGGYIWRYAS